jgi:hypothetical protein
VTADELDVRGDVVRRLERAAIPYYVTGSEALALHGIAYRQTNDTDFVIALAPDGYESILRPAFEPSYLVSPLVAVPPRWLGSAIHVRAVAKADFVIREPGPWPNRAFERRQALDDPALGRVFVGSVEDLLLAKLEWSDGNLDGLQGRDARAIVIGRPGLDVAYAREAARELGIDALLEEVLASA